MKVIGIIPARYASSRFPGKALALINDKPIIRMVYEQASAALEEVYVATDDHRIEEAVLEFGGRVLITSSLHQSGTDRCIEAMQLLYASAKKVDVLINIQGDEPFIKPEQIKLLLDTFHDKNVDISTLVKKIDLTADLLNPNIVKVVRSENNDALYFSRQALPFARGQEINKWLNSSDYYKHIGIYGYRAEVLEQLASLKPTILEKTESLEQLRWMEHGYKIRTSVSKWDSIGIDTPEDLENAKLMLKSD